MFLCRIIVTGYLNNPEATANTIDKDGWLHTGDIAFIDEDEEMFIVDRVKEIIKFKGFQVHIFTNFVTLLSRHSKHLMLILESYMCVFRYRQKLGFMYVSDDGLVCWKLAAKVPPAELEALLVSHEFIEDAAVVS